MITDYGHLTYCSNIHSGEDWDEHFEQLQKHFPVIKKKCSPKAPMAIGLRLSAMAAQTLSKKKERLHFKNWLNQQGAYIFTINGFPYGAFHKTKVKDTVHSPDWTTAKRVRYTKKMATILAELLPAKMEGSISTSPLSYRYWHKSEKATDWAIHKSTNHLVSVVEYLVSLENKTGKTIFIAIEPEPDGLLTDTRSFLHWFNTQLMKSGAALLSEKLGIPTVTARSKLKKHIRLCYDICHAAVNYEDAEENLRQLKKSGIKIGKIQISAALKVAFDQKKGNNEAVIKTIKNYLEPTYLHQVISRRNNGDLTAYPDLPQALKTSHKADIQEWRIHYHVPIFTKKLAPLSTTQGDIVTLLNIHKTTPLTQHLEVETYTWEVLPKNLKKDIADSITREIKWVMNQLKK